MLILSPCESKHPLSPLPHLLFDHPSILPTPTFKSAPHCPTYPLPQHPPPPSFSLLWRCSRQASGRLQRCCGGCGGLRSASSADGCTHLLPEQEEHILQQEEQKGSGHWTGKQHCGGDEDGKGQ